MISFSMGLSSSGAVLQAQNEGPATTRIKGVSLLLVYCSTNSLKVTWKLLEYGSICERNFKPRPKLSVSSR